MKLTDRRDPYVVSWADQFGALLRDKAREMQETILRTGWTNIAHEFDDPYDDDKFRLWYEDGNYLLQNLSTDHDPVLLDLDRLGVNRRV